MKPLLLLFPPLLLTSALLLVIPPVVESAQAPAPSPAADEAKNLPNPVKPTPESLAKAKKLYGYDCSMCHGDKGDGKGDLAQDQKPGDFTNPDTLKDYTDGELYAIIKNGKNTMPGEGERTNADQVWGLVNYIRSLSKK